MANPRFNQPRPQIRTPKTSSEWAQLMAAVIHRAEETGSRHLPGLRHAQAGGKAEALLRKLGIIHLADIDREFPKR